MLTSGLQRVSVGLIYLLLLLRPCTDSLIGSGAAEEISDVM